MSWKKINHVGLFLVWNVAKLPKLLKNEKNLGFFMIVPWLSFYTTFFMMISKKGFAHVQKLDFIPFRSTTPNFA